MEILPESHLGGSTASWGESAGSFGRFGATSQPHRQGLIPTPHAPGDISETFDPSGLASFRVEEMDKGAVVVASGEVDMSTAPALREALLSASRASARVVLDMTGVTFFDSSGLAVLVEALRSSDREQEGSPRLVGPTPPVRRILDVTRVGQRLLIHETVAEALEQPT